MPEAKETTNRSLPIAVFFAITLLLLGGSLFFTAYLTYRHLVARAAVLTKKSTPRTYRFQVSGPSMVPSLYGPTCPTMCERCKRSERVDPKFDQLLPRHRICSVCGGKLKHLASSPVESLIPGDVVEIQELSQAEKTSLKIGDVVAINHESKLRVKRIAALPGDEITIQDQRVLVNNKRLEDIIASRSAISNRTPDLLVVDEDWRQTESRWKPDPKSKSWHQGDQSTWTYQSDTKNNSQWSDWLVYHHRNVHSQDQDGTASISPVVDDYPFNLGLPRQLKEADRLAVAAEIQPVSPVIIQTVFWSSNAAVIVQTQVSAQEPWQVTFYDAKPATILETSTFPVTKNSPIAIRSTGLKNQFQLKKLAVSRLVEYRLRSSDDDNLYPLRLLQGQAFLLGDNVPASEDSRKWGPIRIDNIVGVVIDATTQTGDSVLATPSRE